MIDKIKTFGIVEDLVMEQMKNCCVPEATAASLMADNHLGYSMPIGGVIALKDHIAPGFIGFDISCGNKIVRVDTEYSYVKNNIESIMDEVFKQISFGVGRNSNEVVEAAILERDGHEAWNIKEIGELKRKAANQLGTVGSGNHYVDIFVDEQERVWIGCHFGSRGLGHTIASRYLKLAGGVDSMMAAPTLISTETDLGREYLLAMDLAGKYAYAGRDYVCSKVASIIGGKELESIHNHHNYAWKENHFGQDVWVHRKGATPAFPNQRGFVGGSMGDDSVILKGIDSSENKEALYSTVHGAGRVLSRTKAAGKTKWVRNPETGRKARLQPTGGLITQEMMQEWISKKGVCLRGAGVDESPHCYKRLNEVLKYHSSCVEVEHVLTPLGVAMAGSDITDPYRD